MTVDGHGLRGSISRKEMDDGSIAKKVLEYSSEFGKDFEIHHLDDEGEHPVKF